MAPALALGAQSAAAVASAPSHAVTWCETPSASPVWARQLIQLSLFDRRGHRPEKAKELVAPVDSVIPLDAALGADSWIMTTRPELAQVLGALREPFVIASGFDYPSPAVAGGTPELPAGEPRYSPAALFGDVHFLLRPDGSIDSISFHGVRDSTLAQDLAATLRRAAAASRLPHFDSASGARHLRLSAEFGAPAEAASWPAFTLDIPTARPTVAIRMDPPEYTDERWNATVKLAYLIGADGRAAVWSIQPVPSIDRLTFTSDDQRRAFLSFVEESKKGVRNSTYRPAEYLGCSVVQFVMQEFVFKHR